jgi:hypothetical protein
MNCLESLKEEKYNLKGYNPDTIIFLQEASLPEEECEKLLARLEVEYG